MRKDEDQPFLVSLRAARDGFYSICCCLRLLDIHIILMGTNVSSAEYRGNHKAEHNIRQT
ncbi:hypothetical protein [Paenibacillus silvae]|uniref:hypothetical protein n=1 Tax=Paenibacillus silvae TaxID=1325358 RepID=UPI0020033467|nr:hypothetical protein [Paenibacillus silvae]MCK6076021.1 hypothetical protein [Paenibacillus silvae]MCK6150410.1 hypothetical protein [Paenibacillus silvae]MCK6268708.1 hypothetical protein [Paenibacillus silvae]